MSLETLNTSIDNDPYQQAATDEIARLSVVGASVPKDEMFTSAELAEGAEDLAAYSNIVRDLEKQVDLATPAVAGRIALAEIAESEQVILSGYPEATLALFTGRNERFEDTIGQLLVPNEVHKLKIVGEGATDQASASDAAEENVLVLEPLDDRIRSGYRISAIPTPEELNFIGDWVEKAVLNDASHPQDAGLDQAECIAYTYGLNEDDADAINRMLYTEVESRTVDNGGLSLTDEGDKRTAVWAGRIGNGEIKLVRYDGPTVFGERSVAQASVYSLYVKTPGQSAQ